MDRCLLCLELHLASCGQEARQAACQHCRAFTGLLKDCCKSFLAHPEGSWKPLVAAWNNCFIIMIMTFCRSN